MCRRRVGRSCSAIPPDSFYLQPWVSRLGPVDQVARLSETAIAFARVCLRGIETAIAFAVMKRAFLVHFLVAVVLLVSTVAVQGRAVVTVVSCWPVSLIAVVSSVSTSHVAASGA